MVAIDELMARFRAELAGRIVAMLAAAATTVALARLLSPDEYGLLFLAIAIFTATELFSKLGIAKSAGRYIAEYKSDNPGQLPHILRTALAFNLVTIIVVAIAFLAGHRWIATFVGEPALAPFLTIGAVFIAATTFLTFTRLVLQGFEAIRQAALIHVLEHVSRLTCAVGLVLLGFGAFGALVGYIIAAGLTAIVGFAILYWQYYRPIPPHPSMEVGLARRLAEYTVPLTATNTANVLDKEVDTILVGLFLNPVAVGYYVLSKQLVQFLETPTAALGFTLAPTYGAQSAAGNEMQAARLYESAVAAQLLLYVPMAAGLFLVAEPVIELIFGEEYLGAVVVVQVLSIYVILVAVNRVTSNGLDFLGRARERAIAKGVTAAMNVALNVMLIPTIGVVGAAIATVFTYGIYTVVNVWVITLEFDIRTGWISRRLLAVSAVTVIMATAVLSTVPYITGIFTLIAVVLLGVVIWFGLSTAIGLIQPKAVRILLS